MTYLFRSRWLTGGDRARSRVGAITWPKTRPVGSGPVFVFLHWRRVTPLPSLRLLHQNNFLVFNLENNNEEKTANLDFMLKWYFNAYIERLQLKRWTRVRFPIGSIQRVLKLVLRASLLDVQQLKGPCDASIVCGRQVGRWYLDLKTERSISRLLVKGNMANKM